MWQVLRQVFYQPRYFSLFTAIVFIVLTAALLLPNYTILVQILASEVVSVWSKMVFVLSLYGTITTNYTLFSAANLLSVAVLFGVNITLLVYYIRRRQTAKGGVTAQVASVGGLVSSILGIGCAACGSVVLTALLGMFGASGLLMLLPFHGVEFGLLGLLLLFISVRFLIKKIQDPLVCPTF